MFYDKFLELCAEKGLSPSAAAEEIGMAGAHVTRWKNGSVPTDKTILRIARYFGVSMDYFKEDAQKEKPAVTNDDELAESLEILRERPETRALLHASKGLTAEQVQKMAEFMLFVKGAKNVKTD